MRRTILCCLPMTLVVAAALTFVAACGGCNPNKVIQVQDLILAADATPSPDTLDVGCQTYVFQVAWQGYKHAHAYYRIGPMQGNKTRYTTIVTPLCKGGTCHKTTTVSQPTRQVAYLHIEPEKGERVQETAQGICRITVYGTDGAASAVGNRDDEPGSDTANADCNVNP